MYSLVVRAREKFERDGLIELSKSTCGFFIAKFRRKVLWKISNLYHIQKGYKSFNINSITGKFYANENRQVNNVRYAIESERWVLRDLLKELTQNDIFYDIGAAQGVYSIFASQAVNGVVAFEPVPHHVDIINKNIDINGVSDIVDVVPYAVSDESKEIDAGELGVGIEDGELIQSKSIDGVIADKKIPSPTVVKIDVEGLEMSVVKGMKNVLSSNDLRVIYCEVHQPTEHTSHNTDFEDFVHFIREYGFEIEMSKERGSQIHIKARR